MKSTLIFVAISCMAGVFGSPAARSTHDDSFRAEPDVEKSVNGARSPTSLVAADDNAWACISLNTANRTYGYGLAATQAAASARALSECGSTCKIASQLCVTQGCVAYAAGYKDLELHASAHYGSLAADSQAAQAKALADCKFRSNGCRNVFVQCTSGAN